MNNLRCGVFKHTVAPRFRLSVTLLTNSLLVFNALSFVTPVVQGQDAKLPIAEAKQGSGSFFEAYVDLGEVLAGKQAEVRFLLKNASESRFEIPEVKSSCSCASITVSEKSLAPGKTAEISVTIQTPRNPTKIVQRFNFSLRGETNSPSVEIFCTYKLSGLLAFPNERFVGSFNPNLNREPRPFQIPFLITPPLSAQNLIARGVGGLEDSTCRIDEKDGNYFVNCQLTRNAISEDGIAGEIELRERTSGFSARLPCIIDSVGDFQVVPKRLSLSWSENESCYRGNAIFKLEDEVELEANSAKLTAWLLDLPGTVLIKEQQLGNSSRVYRLAIQVFTDDELPFLKEAVPDSCRWGFKIGAMTYSTAADVSFLPVRYQKEGDK